MPERQARAQAMLGALQTLAAHALATQGPDAAIPLLRRAVALFPLEEPACRLLMQALAANGEYAAAMQAYRQLRRRLSEELRAEPDARTQAVLQELRAAARLRAARGARTGSAYPALVTAAPVPPLTAAAIPPPAACVPDAPLYPAQSHHVPPYHAPRPFTTLIGRRWEAAEVAACLESARLVTLTGAGGVGKTRLVLHVASERQGCYPDGIWFVDLAPLTDPAQVPQAIADALRVPEKTGQTRMQTLQEHLGAHCALLILDNCEHLAAACAATVGELLMACPHLRLLATSRQALDLAGETDWRVPSLTLPPAAPGREEAERDALTAARPASAGMAQEGRIEDRARNRADEDRDIAALMEYEAGAVVRGTRPAGAARLSAHAAEQRGHRGNLPPAGRHPPGAGTGCGARSGTARRADRPDAG